MDEEWQRHCTTYFQKMKVCAFCGYVNLGGRRNNHSHFRQVPPSVLSNQPAPYTMSNPSLAEFTHTACGDWFQCNSCATNISRADHCSFMSPNSFVSAMVT
ncbi:hypothetical protein ABBQ32_002209 [Trebouxia sp. C0010 RCD-2024]